MKQYPLYEISIKSMCKLPPHHLQSTPICVIKMTISSDKIQHDHISLLLSFYFKRIPNTYMYVNIRHFRAVVYGVGCRKEEAVALQNNFPN